jgi:hypothetical protein
MRDSANLQRAFDFLSHVVESRTKAGRSTLAAGVKAEMSRRMPGGFDEKGPDLLFGSFREFLDAARDAGVVDYRRAEHGDDLEIVPQAGATPPRGPSKSYGTAPASPSSTGSHRSRSTTSRNAKRIRRDLWYAFMTWESGLMRVYDTHADIAHVLSAEPSEDEPHELKRVRQELHEWPDRYRAIEPIGEDRRLTWAREFASSLEEQTMAAALRFALEVERPLKAFGEALQTDSVIVRRWREVQKVKVELELRDWAKREGLDLDPFERREPQETGAPSPAVVGIADEPAVDDLRAQLHEVVDALPAETLQGFFRAARTLAGSA